jgi:hypothetical protein
MRFFEKAPGANTFTLKATVAGAGKPHHMIRDGANQLTIYAACDDGLFKTFDGGATWVMLRDFTAGGLQGLQVGYGAITAISVGRGGSGGGPGDPPSGGGGGSTPLALTIVSTAGQGATLGIGTTGVTPAGWTEPTFDDSAWSAPAAQTGAVFGDPPPTGSNWITHPAYNGNGLWNSYEWLLRREFTLPNGVVTSASLSYWADNFLIGIWLNNLFIDGSPGASLLRTVSVPPSAFVVGGANVIAIRIQNEPFPTGGINPTSVAFRLDVH